MRDHIKSLRGNMTTVTTDTLKQGKIAHVSDKLAQRAIDLHEEQMETGAIDPKRLRSATTLMMHHNTQNRLSPERIAELAKMPKASRDVLNLAQLDDDQLNELTLEMLGKKAG